MKVLFFFFYLICFVSWISSFQLPNLSSIESILQEVRCSPFDLELVLDGSESVHPEQWNQTIQFAINLTQALNLSSNGNRLGIISFGTNASKITSPTSSTNTALSALNNAIQPKGLTNIGGAIDLAQADINSYSRTGYPHVILLLVNSNSNFGPNPADVAKVAKEKGSFIYVIGLGGNINYGLIDKIASTPSSVYVLKKDYNQLDSQLVIDFLLVSCIKQCVTPIDLELVVDGSSSIESHEWIELKNFLQQLITRFVISSSGTRIGFTQFGSNAQSYLSLTYDISSIFQIIQKVTQMGGTTNIGDGLKVAQGDISSKGRDKIPHVILLITNGNQNSGPDANPIADEAKKNGTIIYIIAVGEVNLDLINPLASSPASTHVFSSDFGKLDDIIPLFSLSACGKEICNSSIDIELILDGSSSISSTSWKQLIDFSVNFVSSFIISPTETHIGIVQFASSSRLELSLSSNQTTTINILKSLKQMTGGTYLDLGINTAQSDISNKGRIDSPHVMVILTDGDSSGDPIGAATKAKKAGTEIFCVGIGSSINQAQLNAIASPPISTHVFLANDFGTLINIIKILISTTCPQ